MNSITCVILLDTCQSGLQCGAQLQELDSDHIEEVIVVNTTPNPFTHAPAAQHSHCQIIDLPGASFAKAANTAILASSSDLLLFLPAECIPTIHAIKKLAEVLLAHPYAALACGKLTTENNGYIPSARRFPGFCNILVRSSGLAGLLPKTPLNCMEYARADWSEAKNVCWSDFSFCAIKKEMFQQIGLFDEGFSTRMATADFCSRITRNINKPNTVLYSPQNVCRVSEKSELAQKRMGYPLQYGDKRHVAEDTLCFLQKRMGFPYALLGATAGLLGSALLFAMTLVPYAAAKHYHESAREQLRDYRSAITKTRLGKTSSLL